MGSSRITLRAATELAATPQQLWPLLSDTARIDRMLGLPAFERSALQPDLAFKVQSHYFGVPVTWHEYPYEWVFEQWYQVTRTFEAPVPVRQLMTRTTLSELPGGRSHVDVIVEFEPRGLLGRTLARLFIGRKLLRDLLNTYRTFAQQALTAEQLAPAPVSAPSVSAARLAVAAERLRQSGARPALVDRLTEHLRSADDPEVLRMRPFALADAWRADRLEVLRMFLYATRAGLLDLEWDVLCPNCRGPSLRAGQLQDLAADAHCNSCNIRYDINFDESVELRFSANPDIRAAADLAYCIGGPGQTRHIVAQIWLPARATKQLQLELAMGDYRLRTRQLVPMARMHADAADSARQTVIRLSDDDLVVEQPHLAAGPLELTLENASGDSLLVVIEQTAWSAQAVSAALVTTLSEFRQLFSSQVLAPGLGVSIRNLTFMFSDLQGSTALYDQIGDSPAYARVRDHFDVMSEIIARRRGALVKTIGDAVMAVFASVEDALAAGLEIQREFTSGQIARGDPPLRVKLGLHRGPCIAVNANGLLDYFGTTVNIAARVQNESVGGDIVVTDELLSDPGVRELLRGEQLTIEPFQRDLKGFSQAFALARLRVSGTTRRAAA